MKIVLAYLSRHVQAARQSLSQFHQNPLASTATCLVIGIALALPTLLFVGLKNLEMVSSNLTKTVQITLFLKPSTKLNEVNKLIETINADKNTQSVTQISPEEGLKELQEQTGWSGANLPLPKNPLPWTIVITPKITTSIEAWATSLKALPQIDFIQMDQVWIDRLKSLSAFAKRFFISMAIFLGVGIFLVINNVIRSATQQNQKEIQVIKLIGGTNSFIRRPFLYSGVIFGLLGAIIAWQLVDVLLLILKEPVTHFASFYQSSFYLRGLNFYNSLSLLLSGVLLGLSAAWLAVSRHLKNR